MRAVLAAAGISMCAAAAAAQQPAPTDRSAEIRARERALSEAMHARDRARLEALLAPDYVLRGAPDIDRETWIRNAVTLCWGDRSDIEGFRTRLDGDVIVASFELIFYVDPATCRPAVLRSLITDVWVRQPDGWRLQVRHSGPQPTAAAGVAGQYGIVPEPPPTWEVASEVSFVATGGNTSTQTLGLGGELVHRGPRSSTRGAIAFVTTEADETTQARSVRLQARHGIGVRQGLEVFGRGAYARDRFAGIDSRITAEGGVAYTPPLPPRHALTAEGALGYTAEDRRDSMDLRFVNATGTMKYAWTVRRGTTIGEDVAVTADLESAGNWRGTSVTTLAVTLTQVLSVKASHAIEYRNRPVVGFGRRDSRTSAALVLSFARRPPIR